MTAPVAPVAAPAPTFNQAVLNVANKTTIPADIPAPAPTVQIVKDAAAVPPVPAVPATLPVSPSAPTVVPGADADVRAQSDAGGEQAAVAPVAAEIVPDATAPAVPAVEPAGELTVDDGELRLASERNADGTFRTKIDPTAKFELQIIDKTSGETKTYTKTLPELMRMAKDGIWGQKARAEVSYYRENVPKWEATHTSLRSSLEEMTALNRELLTAPDDIVIARREQYATEMSPEKQLARLKAEREQEAHERTRSASEQDIARQANTFIMTRLAPVVGNAGQVLGVETVAGKIALGTAPFMVNGQIPPSNWPAVEAWIHGPFKQWVTTETAKKTQADAATKAARDAADAARRTAQSAVNDAQRTSVPIGRAAPDTPAALPKPKNTQEAVTRMINRPLPQTVSASG